MTARLLKLLCLLGWHVWYRPDLYSRECLACARVDFLISTDSGYLRWVRK